jgi:hypothetical protein
VDGVSQIYVYEDDVNMLDVFTQSLQANTGIVL